MTLLSTTDGVPVDPPAEPPSRVDLKAEHASWQCAACRTHHGSVGAEIGCSRAYIAKLEAALARAVERTERAEAELARLRAKFEFEERRNSDLELRLRGVPVR